MVIGPVADAMRKANGHVRGFANLSDCQIGSSYVKIAKIANVFVITPPAILARPVITARTRSLQAQTPPRAKKRQKARRNDDQAIDQIKQPGDRSPGRVVMGFVLISRGTQ